MLMFSCIISYMSMILLLVPDAHYGDVRALSSDLVSCINREVVALSQAGCRYIQVDEPVLVREPETALEYGIDHLSQCFKVTVNQYIHHL